jgi:magnesium chelatase family protein
VQRYQQRISRPLMDRIDIVLEMARVPFAKLSSLEAGEPSAAIRARVEAAHAVPWRLGAPIHHAPLQFATSGVDS